MSNQEDINDLKRLINYHKRRLQKLKERQALEGMSTDPKVLIEIEDIEIKIADLQKRLEGLQDNILLGSQDRKRNHLSAIQIAGEIAKNQMIGLTYRTGENSPTRGVYDYVSHINATGCIPTPEERRITLDRGEKFPPHRSCSKGVIWKLVRIL